MRLLGLWWFLVLATAWSCQKSLVWGVTLDTIAKKIGIQIRWNGYQRIRLSCLDLLFI